MDEMCEWPAPAHEWPLMPSLTARMPLVACRSDGPSRAPCPLAPSLPRLTITTPSSYHHHFQVCHPSTPPFPLTPLLPHLAALPSPSPHPMAPSSPWRPCSRAAGPCRLVSQDPVAVRQNPDPVAVRQDPVNECRRTLWPCGRTL
ncbi:hypothetical protein HaLaN_19933 [Haematococcus lacustris]|uniref:Uncharacterized protein n=1 Tax=Haematococcus lacustris TaxID=44745 RepID=A0A6A0A0W1_HAELA|nr:hypothetical protein HaLaN_19933 [Haematococcus lacustris]